MKNTLIVGFGKVASGIGKNRNVNHDVFYPDFVLGAYQKKEFKNIFVYDTDKSKLALANDIGLKGYSNFNKLLNEVKLDVAYITTRSDCRLDYLKILSNNDMKKFYLEKPIITSRTEIDYLKKQIFNKKLLFISGFRRRNLSQYSIIKNLIDESTFGDIKKIIINTGSNLLFWDIIHFIDLINYLIDKKITFVNGSLNAFHGEHINFNQVFSEFKVNYLKFKCNAIPIGIKPSNYNKIKIFFDSDVLTLDEKNFDIYINRKLFHEYNGIQSGFNLIRKQLESYDTNDLKFESMVSTLSSHNLVFDLIDKILKFERSLERKYIGYKNSLPA